MVVPKFNIMDVVYIYISGKAYPRFVSEIIIKGNSEPPKYKLNYQTHVYEESELFENVNRSDIAPFS